MTDTTTHGPNGEPSAEPADPASVAATPAAEVEAQQAAGEPVTFWHRPYVERYLVPIVLPLAVIVFLVAYVINLSRIFLSSHGHIPVISGSVLTVIIIVGASLLSAASPRLRQSAITLLSAGFIIAVMSAGWLVIGHSAAEKTGPVALAPDLKTSQTENVIAAPGGNLAFDPNNLTGASTGLVKISVKVAAPGHTFAFEDPTTLLSTSNPLKLDAAGTTVNGVAFFSHPGDYKFICTVDGHAAAGMNGVIHVTKGGTVTLEQAVTAAGNPASAAK